MKDMIVLESALQDATIYITCHKSDEDEGFVITIKGESGISDSVVLHRTTLIDAITRANFNAV